jgi:DNA sulfur modification protein DndB
VNDEYSVIFVAHIDDPEGKVVTRRLFSDINKRAVPVSKGDKVVIDEDEIEAIVARRLFANYRYFKGGKIIANTEQPQLPDGDKEHFTNLLTLYSVNQRLRKLWRCPRGRPEYDPENVVAFLAVASGFYDFVIKHVPSFRSYFIDGRTTLGAQRRNNRNLLFRPAGLLVLAQLYVHFTRRDELIRLAEGLERLNFISPGGIFDNVLWKNGKVGPRFSDRTASVNLIAYLLGIDVETSDELLDRLREVLKDRTYTLPGRIIPPSAPDSVPAVTARTRRRVR